MNAGRPAHTADGNIQRMSPRRPLLIASLAALAAGVAGSGALATRGSPALHIATWNLQWLVDPDTAREARVACRAGRRAALPCDVARDLARDSADLARLAHYTRRLDADVIAIQEVENIAIARRVLPGYTFCLSEGPGVQQVGFAVRQGLAHECGPPLEQLSAGGRGRPGVTLTLRPPGMPAIEVLSVHLKSGCARDPLHSGSAACVLLARQAEALGHWIATRVAQGAAFIVAGDLNRGGLPTHDDDFWRVLGPEHFVAAAQHLPFSNCAFGDPYTDFIDHVLVSHALVPQLAAPAFGRLVFRTSDAARYRLSDHCPVSVSLIPGGAL